MTVIRFYVSCLLLLASSSSLLSISCSSLSHTQNISNCPCRRPPPAQLQLAIHSFCCRTQPRLSTPSGPCRTSTTIIHAQGSLPDLNGDHPRPLFRIGPQRRPSTPSFPCRTSTATIHAECSLPHLNHPCPVSLRDLNHDYPRPVIPAGPQSRPSIVLATRNISFTDVTVSGNVVKTSRFSRFF